MNEIGEIVVLGAVNYSKKIRKVGADMFANVGAKKPYKLDIVLKLVSKCR